MSRISFHFLHSIMLLILLLSVALFPQMSADTESTPRTDQSEPVEDKTVVSLDERIEYYLNENTIQVIEELHDRELQVLNLVTNIHDEVAARGREGLEKETGFEQVFGAQEQLVSEYEQELARLVKVYDDLNYLKELADYVNDVEGSLDVLEAKSQIFATLDDRELYKKSIYSPEYVGKMVDEYTEELDSLLNIYDGLEHIQVRAEAYNDQEALAQIQQQKGQVLKVLSQWGNLGPLTQEEYEKLHAEVNQLHSTAKKIQEKEKTALGKELDQLAKVQKDLVSSLDQTVYDILADAEYKLDVYPTVEEFIKSWKIERLTDIKARLAQYQIIWNNLVQTAGEKERRRMYQAELDDALYNYSRDDFRTAEYQLLDILDRYNLTNSEKIPIMYYLGEARWHRRAYEQAKEQFEQLLEYPVSSYTIEALVRLMQYENDFGTTARFYQLYKQVEANREFGVGDIIYYAHYLMANKQFENHQYFETLKIVDKIVERSSFYLPGQLLKAITLINLNRLDEAVPVLESIVKERSLPWTDINVADLRNRAHLRLGLIYYQMGRFIDAIGHLEQVSRGFEHYDQALMARAWCKFRLNDFESARDLANQLLQDQFASDYTYEALVLYGHCNQILNSNEDALDAYRYVVRARGVLDVKKEYDAQRMGMRAELDQLEQIENQAIQRRQAGVYVEISRLKNELNEFLVATRERGDTGTELLQDYYEERLDVADKLIELDRIIQWAFEQGRGDLAVKADEQRSRLIAALETYQADQKVSNTTYLIDYPLAAREASMMYRRNTWGDVYREIYNEKNRIEKTLTDVEEYQDRLSTAGAVGSKMELEVLQFDINNLRDRLDVVRKAMTEAGMEEPKSNADYWSDLSGFEMSDIIFQEREKRLQQIDDYSTRLAVIQNIFEVRQKELLARIDEFEQDLMRIQNSLLSRKIQLEQLERDTYFRNYYFETREYEEETWEDRLRRIE